MPLDTSAFPQQGDLHSKSRGVDGLTVRLFIMSLVPTPNVTNVATYFSRLAENVCGICVIDNASGMLSYTCVVRECVQEAFVLVFNVMRLVAS